MEKFEGVEEECEECEECDVSWNVCVSVSASEVLPGRCDAGGADRTVAVKCGASSSSSSLLVFLDEVGEEDGLSLREEVWCLWETAGIISDFGELRGEEDEEG